jgi:periplasmic divalent cation tolerance protein
MQFFYVTLNNSEEARQISHSLLENKLALCTNWFPITCAYRWEGKVVEEPEVVLIIKTQPSYRQAIEAVIQEHIDYINCVAALAVESVNDSFLSWLNMEIPRELQESHINSTRLSPMGEALAMAAVDPSRSLRLIEKLLITTSGRHGIN